MAIERALEEVEEIISQCDINSDVSPRIERIRDELEDALGREDREDAEGPDLEPAVEGADAGSDRPLSSYDY